MTTSEIHKSLIERFQCPGCVCGSDTTCGTFEPSDVYGATCNGHVPGTSVLTGTGFVRFALGLPRGFNRVNSPQSPNIGGPKPTTGIRLWRAGTAPTFDSFNIPVWALEGHHSVDTKLHGFLFVRTFSPRINATYVDVIEGGTLADVPGAIDVGAFYAEID